MSKPLASWVPPISALTLRNRQCARLARSASRGAVERVYLVEQPHDLRHVVAILLQGLRVPFTALGAEEVSPVDVDGAGQTRDRIGHRVDDVATEGFGVFRRQRFRARGF